MKRKNFSQLKQFDRDRIDILFNNGYLQKDVAKIIQCSESTISREIKRNRRRKRKNKEVILGKYESSVANQKAYVRRKYAKWQGQKIDNNDDLKKYIVKKLKAGWSPDDISGRMKAVNKPFYASKNAIYRWLYHGRGVSFCGYLASKRYRPKKHKEKSKQKQLIPLRTSIDKRPEVINQRVEPGHFEADTIVSGKKTGSKEALAVAIERKFRYAKLNKIKSLSPINFNKAIKDFKTAVIMKSATMDNGLENRYHYQLGMQTYFCDPYASWQKGGVENVNGLIRRYIPKGSDISQYSDEYVKMVEDVLNHRPRKSLGYKTPYECMKEAGLLKQKTIKKPRA